MDKKSGLDIQAIKSALDSITKNSPQSGMCKNGIPPAPPPPPVVKGLWYNEKVIKVDGWHFENCRFDKCLFVAESPYFSFKDCFIDGSNALEFKGAVVKLFQLAECMSIRLGADKLKPVRNADGTVSIGLAHGD